MSDLPILIDASGPVAKTSNELRQKLVEKAQALSPGLTDNLPGSLVEDIVSTSVGALIICDQARVDLLNSIGPRTGNLNMLTQLAEQYGVPSRRSEGLTTVNLIFEGTPGFVVSQGFRVSDGTHQYILQDAVIVPTDGKTDPMVAYGSVSGQWAVSALTVTKLITSVPDNIKLSVSNPTAGTPAAGSESVSDFRDRVWQAGMSNVSAYPGFIRTELSKVTNIVNRLTSVKNIGNKWYVICSGGDLYSMAGAIFKSAGDFTRLAAFVLEIASMTKGEETIVETNYTHGFSTGQIIQFHDMVLWNELNDRDFVITVTSPNTFTIPYDTSTLDGNFDGTGNITPNLRAHSVIINDWPDNYTIPFSEPLQQKVTIQYQWNTTQSSYLSSAAISEVVIIPTVEYINSISSGNPININTLKGIFMSQVDTISNQDIIDTLKVVVTSNGYAVEPEGDESVIWGDAFSYWYIEKDSVGVKDA